MADSRWVVDTAPLIALVGGGRFLGRSARRAFREASKGRGVFAVPTVCLFEVAQLEERGKLRLRVPFDEWCDLIAEAPIFKLVSLDREHVAEARALPALHDPFDRLIAGTAVALGLPLVTRDEVIAESGRVDVIW